MSFKKIKSHEEYREVFKDADSVNTFALDKVTIKNGKLRKLEVFSFFEKRVLETVRAHANKLPEYEGKVSPNLRKLKENDYDLLFWKAVEWDGGLAIIKCYKHHFDGSDAFKLEVTKQVIGKKGRQFIAPFSGVSSSVKLIKTLTGNAKPVSHTHRPWCEIGDFFDHMTDSFDGKGDQTQMKEFRKQRDAHAKRHKLCKPYNYKDFF